MSCPILTLNDGTRVPPFAFGTGTAWFNRNRDDSVSDALVDAVKNALKAGYRHIDSALMYGNEQSTGIAIAESGIARQELFVTTKIGNPFLAGDIKATLLQQLTKLKLDYVDLYLIHQPPRPESGVTLTDVWPKMEALVEAGLTRSIGISNHGAHEIDEIMRVAKIKPSVNQIEYHPYVTTDKRATVEASNKHGITIAAFSPSAPQTKRLGQGPLPHLEDIARSLSERAGTAVTPVQVLLKWNADQGNIVVTTTRTPARLVEQLAVPTLPALNPEENRVIADIGDSVTLRGLGPPLGGPSSRAGGPPLR